MPDVGWIAYSAELCLIVIHWFYTEICQEGYRRLVENQLVYIHSKQRFIPETTVLGHLPLARNDNQRIHKRGHCYWSQMACGISPTGSSKCPTLPKWASANARSALDHFTICYGFFCKYLQVCSLCCLGALALFLLKFALYYCNFLL